MSASHWVGQRVSREDRVNQLAGSLAPLTGNARLYPLENMALTAVFQQMDLAKIPDGVRGNEGEKYMTLTTFEKLPNPSGPATQVAARGSTLSAPAVGLQCLSGSI